VESAIPSHHAFRAGSLRRGAEGHGFFDVESRWFLHERADARFQAWQGDLGVQMGGSHHEDRVKLLAGEEIRQVRVPIGDFEFLAPLFSNFVYRVADRDHIYILKGLKRSQVGPAPLPATDYRYF
jgi:hypothetical protein